MSITIKDAIYVLFYLTSVFSVYFIARNRINNLEKDSRLFKKILYKERGALNLIDTETCKRHRDEVFSQIRRGEKVAEMLLANMQELNRNVITIMAYLDIKGPNGVKKKDD